MRVPACGLPRGAWRLCEEGCVRSLPPPCPRPTPPALSRDPQLVATPECVLRSGVSLGKELGPPR